jgi:hypothetical protein
VRGDDEHVRYCQGSECVKIFPGCPDITSQAAGNEPLPGRPGSKFWIAGKIFSVHNFFDTVFSIQANLITNFWARQPGRQVGGKFQSWVLEKKLSGYQVPE